MEYQWISDRKMCVNELHMLKRRLRIEINIIDCLLSESQNRINITKEDVEYFEKSGYRIKEDGIHYFIVL